MKDLNSFKQFYFGNLTVSFYKRYLCFVLFYYLILIIIAQLSYPGGYSLFENTISDMGGLRNNPNAWWVYTIGGSLVGILLIPVFIFNRNNALKFEKTLANVYLFFSIIGALSFSLVCGIPQDFGTPHDVFADLAFDGLGFGVFTSLILELKILHQNKSNYRKKWLFPIYAPIFIIGILQAIFQNITFDEQIVDPKWTDWPIWQWCLMLSVLWSILWYTMSAKKIE